MKLSIIVPVYNAEPYLKECLTMLLEQPFEDFEIIVVNDGSTDSSEQICFSVMEKSNRIRYLYQQNEGPSAARNLGLQRASGEYVGFCDADDKIDTQMYDILLKRAIGEQAEMVICDYFSERDQKNGGLPWEDGTCLDRERILKEFVPSMIGSIEDFGIDSPIWGSVCRGVFKKEIIEQYEISFPKEIRFAEDLIFTIRFLEYAKKVMIVNRTLYYYTCNPNSIMNSHKTYKEEMFETRLLVLKYLTEVLKRMGILVENQSRLDVTARAYFYEAVGNACRNMKERGRKKAYQEVMGILRDARVSHVFLHYKGRWCKNKFFYFLLKNKCGLILTSYYYLRFGGK